MKLRLGDKIFLVWGSFLIFGVIFYPNPYSSFVDDIGSFLVLVGLPWVVYNWMSNRRMKSKIKQKNALQHA